MGDLNDFSLAEKAVEVAVKEFGGLDGLIVNHGSMFGVNKVSNCELEEWSKMLNVNFISAVAFVCFWKPNYPSTIESVLRGTQVQGPPIPMTPALNSPS